MKKRMKTILTKINEWVGGDTIPSKPSKQRSAKPSKPSKQRSAKPSKLAKPAFTLMEVNLAMFVMAVGTLGLVSLYSFGYRENQQSIEDVRAASVAEVNMNAIIAALSSTNMTWTQWNSIGVQPPDGWGYYAGDGTGVDWEDNDNGQQQKINPPSLGAMNGMTGSIFGKIMGLSSSQGSFYDGDGLACGLVVNQEGDRCSVAFRCGKRAANLVFQPLYYTEVRFQGLRD